MFKPTRRRVLKGAAGVIGAAGVSAQQRAAAAPAVDRAVSVTGTTLHQAAAPQAPTGYTRLMAGPGWGLVVREELAAASPRRDDTRAPLASIVQFTDLHVIDAQSPVRFEFLHSVNGSAFRPQESLGTHGAVQLVQRVNTLKRGPFTGRAFDCLVSTGDNTDNHEHVELEWFLAAMNGGSITQNTGAANRWEGVQTGGDARYYNVQDAGVVDTYKKVGFPTIDGFFARVTRAHSSPGLDIPWFSVFGNHDDSVSGVLPSDWGALAAMYVGDVKFTGFAASGTDRALREALRAHDREILRHDSTPDDAWHVTPDARRRPFTPVEYMEAHLPSGGHGFTEENVATGRGYYSFRIADGVTGIALDSTNRAGFTEGSLGHEQFTWLQRRLQQGSGRYVDAFGIERRHQVDDELFVVFSHHTSGSMTNVLLDPANPEIRHGGAEVRNTLQRFPNVLAWVNGHTHENHVTPQQHRDARRSFWEINTASHVDFPQLARIIEICDNGEGSLSIFATLIESAAPYEAPYAASTQADLASLYREFSFNDPMASRSAIGGPGDRNVELLLRDPRR